MKKYILGKNLSTVLILLGILILATFLRFYRFFPNLTLNGEMGTDYMNVWNIIHGTRTFLIGPRTSHEWFFIPPISYWIYVALLFFGKYSPVIINLFWGLVGVVAVPICYYYVKKLFDEKVAVIASFLLAVSPIWLSYTRAARYNAPVALFFFPYLYYLKKSIEDKGKSLFAIGVILGLSMSFFPSVFLLAPAVIVSFIFYKVKIKFRYILYSVLGFLIPNITFIIYEFTNKFEITVSLLEWIPYRILGFFGLYQKNTINGGVLSDNLYSVYHFVANEFVPSSLLISIFIFGLILIGTIILVKKYIGQKTREMPFFLLIINLTVAYLCLFIHGDPPEHYYLVILPIPIILVAIIITKFISKKFLLLTSILIALFCLWNLARTDWFYQNKILAEYPVTQVPYTVQLQVIDKIMEDVKSNDFSIRRVGVNDQFENDFANNYIYLLTIRGAKINSDSKIFYTIVEIKDDVKPSGAKIWDKNGVSIYKFQNG